MSLFDTKTDWRQFMTPVARAEDALSRLDERLSTSSFRQGWSNRMDYLDAAAAVWNGGELISQEDFILHDHQMDVRAPTSELERAQEVLNARRGAVLRPSRDTLTYQGVKGLTGAWEEREAPASLPIDRPAISQTVRDLLAFADALEAESELPSKREASILSLAPKDDSGDEVLDLWLCAMRDAQTLPPTLAVAMLIDQWARLDPVPRKNWVGRILASVYFKHRGRSDVLLPLHLGRKIFRRQLVAKRQGETLIDILTQIETASREGLALHGKLVLADEMMRRKLRVKRKTSHLEGVIKLLLDQPIVTPTMVEKKLKVSDRAAVSLLEELAPVAREITGRKRFRAWAVAQ